MATKTNTKINGRDYYKITRTIGHEIVNGKKKPIKKQFYGASKTQAEKKYQEWLLDQERLKSQAVDSNKPLGAVIDYYIENIFAVSSEYRSSTKTRYIGAYNQLAQKDKTRLLSTPIQAVTSSDIQIAYNKFNVALSTVQTLNKFLNGFFKWAMLNRYCNEVMSAVVIPDKPYTPRSDDITIWTDLQLEQIEAASRGWRLRFMIFIGKYTGLRISEMLGLKYSDFSDGFLKLRRQYYRGEETPPKYNSVRDIPLHPVLLQELADHKRMHQQEMKERGYKSEYVFTTVNGFPFDDSSVRHQFEHFYSRNGIDPQSFHTYRHTFCTNMVKAGVPLQIASKLMGHKNIETTAKYYTFVSQQEQIDAIGKLT